MTVILAGLVSASWVVSVGLFLEAWSIAFWVLVLALFILGFVELELSRRAGLRPARVMPTQRSAASGPRSASGFRPLRASYARVRRDRLQAKRALSPECSLHACCLDSVGDVRPRREALTGGWLTRFHAVGCWV